MFRGRQSLLGRKASGAGEDPLSPAQVDRVRAVLSLGGVPYADLQDAVQQIRLRLLERAASGREAPRDIGAWAAVVASNLAADWHRGRGRQERIGARLAALTPPDGAAEGGQEARLLALTVAAGLDELPGPQRQALVLRFYADLSVPRIAAELGIPEGTVKSRLYAAAGAMRERMALLRTDEVV
ncbi:RNA polymerase sigma factor [Streptomyces sp. NBC_01237]|uniref:RNA polymerase sigma factor n=1 Tax=Streptomyces sp. NBC_01237 TaxID=2903790 RepID=UPI003FA3DC52